MFHFINGGLDLLVAGVVAAQYAFVRAMFSQMAYSPQYKKDPPPEFVLDIFLGAIVFFGLAHLVAVILNVMVGFFIEQRRHRTFSMIVAGLNCLQMPIGTLLGIFTIIVLNRDSVRARYAEAQRLTSSHA